MKEEEPEKEVDVDSMLGREKGEGVVEEKDTREGRDPKTEEEEEVVEATKEEG